MANIASAGGVGRRSTQSLMSGISDPYDIFGNDTDPITVNQKMVNASRSLEGTPQASKSAPIEEEQPQAKQNPLSLTEKVQQAAQDPMHAMRDQFAVPVTERQWNIISRAAAASENPEEELSRYATALTFSREYGITLDAAYSNLDDLSKNLTGKKFTPNATGFQAIANSFKAGRLNMQFSDLAYDFKQADLNGEDTSAMLSQLDEMGNEIAGLKDHQSRNVLTTVLKWTAEGAVPYMMEVGKSALAGATMAGGLGTAFTAATGITLGSLAAASPYTLAAVIAAGATVGAVNRTRELMEGASYLQLRQMGVDKDIANVGSRTYGLVVGAIEAGLGIEAGTVIKAVGGSNLVSSASSKVMAKMITSGKLGTLVQGLAALGANATGEAVEEMIEEPLDYMTRHISYAIQDSRELGSLDPLPDENLVRNTLEAGLRGFASAIVLGGPSAVIDGKMNLDQQAGIRREAASVPSKEAFVASMKEQKPETITQADWTGAMSEIWDKEHSTKAESTAIQSDENAVAELDIEKAEIQPQGEVRRLKDGNLYTHEASETSVSPDGTEQRRLLVGDPATSSRYGYIDYGIKDNTITIEDVLVKSGYESIRKEAVLSLAKEYPGYDIQWEPKSDALSSVRDEILSSNPRGKEAGMQYWDGITDVDDRVMVERQIEQAMPNLSAPERALGATLVQLRAEAAGMNTQAYLDASYKDGKLFGDTENLAVNMQGKRGAVAFDDDLKAIIYAGQKADFSTFAHETFHVSLRQMGQLYQFKSAVAEASQKPEFITWLDEHAELFADSVFEGKNAQDLADIAAGFTIEDWGRTQEEFAARLYEGYLADGKTASSKLKQLFNQIAKWMAQIYTTLRHSVDLDPRIIEVFDSLSDNQSPLAKQLVTQDVNNGQMKSEALYQGDEGFMKAPNGKRTNLTEKQWKQVRTPEFIKWFGDWENDPENASKVLDENGEPLVVYHGTTTLFDAFDLSKIGMASDTGDYGVGFYFDRNKDVADAYTFGNKNGRVISVFLNIKNPVKYAPTSSAQDNAPVPSIIIESLESAGYEITEEEKNLSYYKFMNKVGLRLNGGQYEGEPFTPEFARYLFLATLNGKTLITEALVRNGVDGAFIDGEYVAFSSSQIKSATDNDGAFDGSNPNILFQPAPPTDSEAFKAWFGDSKVVDDNGEPLVVYHGTDAAFTTFDNTGEKLPSLGYGYYFTPDISKAQQYGANIMPVYISAERLLDWGSLSNEDRSKIIDRLNDKVPESGKAGYGREVRKSFDDTEKGRQAGAKFFEKKKAETENYFHERAKVREERSLDGLKIDVVWMEPGLDNASNQDLLALAQQYDIQIAENLGYDAARFGNEIVVFAPTQIKSATDNIGTFDAGNPNILYQSAYHGTGATFDKFDSEFMGNGEGSQAYGWGFYLSSSFGVSNNYRIIAAYNPDSQKINGRPLNDEYDRIERLASKSSWMYEILEGLEMLMLHETRNAVIEQLTENEADKRSIDYFRNAKYKTFGNVYVTNFSDDLNVVDYYKPLSQKDYASLVETLKQMGEDQDNEDYMNDLLDSLNPEMTSSTIYGIIAGTMEEDVESKRATSELFDSIGINGFSYPAKDQAGNESDTGTNYVIFDPAKINVESPVLFQEENQQEITDRILEEARGFDSWQDWKSFYRAFEDPDNPAPSDDAWYEDMYNKAHGITSEEEAQQAEEAKRQLETEQEKDQYMIDQLSTDSGVRAFMNKLEWMISGRALRDVEGDEQAAETITRVQQTAPGLVNPFILSNVHRLMAGRRISDKAVKSIRTMMTGDALRYYRDLYADVMEDPTLKPQVIDERLPGIEDPGYRELERMSISERLKLANRIEAKNLKDLILSGAELFSGQAEKVIKDADLQIKELNEQKAGLEKQIADLEKDLTSEQQTRILVAVTYMDDRKKLDAELKKLQKLNNEGKPAPKGYSDSALSTQAKLDKLHGEVIQMRKDARMDATIKKYEAIAKLKEQIADKQAEKAEAKKVREYKVSLARKIMVKPSDAINYEQAKAMYGIQALIDPNFRREGVNVAMFGGKATLTAEEARSYIADAFAEGSTEDEIIDAIGKRNYERLVEQRKPLNDWTIQELEELANQVAELRYEGRRILEAKKERQIVIAQQYQDAIIRSLIATGKYTERPIVGTREDQEEKTSPKRTVLALRYATLPMRAKAMMLDGDTQGAAYNLLVLQKRAAQAREWVATEKRMKPVMQAMKDAGVTEKDLYNTVSVALEPGKSIEMTYSSLMYIYLSQFNEDNRQAVAYGNLVTQDEKAALSHDNKLIRALGNSRYEAVLDQAEFLLSEENGKYMQVLDAVRSDFNGQKERLNEVAIREFNKPMRTVDEYLSIHRKEFSGEDMGQQVADDLFNQNAGGLPTGVQKGFTQDRIAISADHQRPIDLDLMQVWNRSVRQQEHFIAFAEYGRKLNRVFKNPGAADVKNVIIRTLGQEMLDDINDYIGDVVNPVREAKLKRMESAVRFMRGNLGAAYLTWKLSSMVLQTITSPAPFIIDVKPMYLAKGYMELASHPLETIERINEMSPMMKNRTMNVIIDQILQQSRTYTQSGVKRALFSMQELGSMGLTMVDRYAVAGGWLGAYHQRLDQLTAEGLDTAKAEQMAVVYADDITLKTQPTGDATEIAPLFTTGSEFAKAFTQFTTSMNVIWSNLTYDMPVAVRKGHLSKVLGTLIGYGLAGAVLGAVANGFDDDDDEIDKLRKWIYWSFTQGTGSIPLIGDQVDEVVKSAITGDKPVFFADDFFPGMSKVLKGVGNLTQGEFDKAFENLSKGAGYMYGVPVSGIQQAYDATQEGPQVLLGR